MITFLFHNCLHLLEDAIGQSALHVYYRPYPQTRNCEIKSFTSGWQIAKGGKGALFYSQIAVNNGKGRRVQ